MEEKDNNFFTLPMLSRYLYKNNIIVLFYIYLSTQIIS